MLSSSNNYNNDYTTTTNAIIILAKYRSPIYVFFFDIYSTMSNYDSVFSTISIVSALFLTIPFATAGYFDSDFFESFQAQIESCPSNSVWGKTYAKSNKIIDVMNQSSTNVIFCSLMGIIISTVYFILKPPNLEAIPKWSKIKLKFLALLGSTVLLVNIIYIMFVGIFVSSYMMVPLSSCGDNPIFWAGGLVGFVVIMAVSIYLLA